MAHTSVENGGLVVAVGGRRCVLGWCWFVQWNVLRCLRPSSCFWLPFLSLCSMLWSSTCSLDVCSGRRWFVVGPLSPFLRGPAPTMLTVFISGVLTGVVLLHRSPVDARILALGHRSGRNDGCAWKQRTVRHVALGPVLVLLKSVEPEPSPSTSGWTTTLTAVALVLPFLLFTTFVGHQVWSVDAKVNWPSRARGGSILPGGRSSIHGHAPHVRHEESCGP